MQMLSPSNSHSNEDLPKDTRQDVISSQQNMMIVEDSMPSFRGPSNHNRDVDSIKGDEEE